MTPPLDADTVVRPPAWILETLHRAKMLGLHANQRRQIATLLGWLEIEEFDLPRLQFHGRQEMSYVELAWHGHGHLVEAGLYWSQFEGWRTRLTLYRGGDMVRQWWPRHPASPLRGLLSRVSPGMFRGRDER